MAGVLSANMVFEQVDGWPILETDMTLSRRDLLKAQAAAIAAAAASISVPAAAQPVPAASDALEIKWSKAPCRFCGTGCGVMVGVKEGKVVATHGDTHAEVNRGLNCIKGYFLSKIMYGGDRLTTPLLRKKDGVYDKDGEFDAGQLGRSLRRHGRAGQGGAEGEGPDRASACSARDSGRSAKAMPRPS